MNVGDTFLMDHPPGRGKHLVIVAEKTEKSDWLLICVHITTVKMSDYEDHSCILKNGDHNFIKHDSYVKYSNMFMAKDVYIDQQISIGTISSKGSLNPDVLLRIQKGALVSDSIKNRHKEYFEKYE